MRTANVIICFRLKRLLGNSALVACILATVFLALSINLFALQKATKTLDNAAINATANRSLPIYSVETEEKRVAISFDCAWGVDHTDALLECMAKNDVRCTFFAVQFWVEKYPQYVEKIVAGGHEIGSHSRTHSYMSKLSKTEIQDELTTSCQAIEKITGKKVTLFRPPYGDYDNLLIDTCNQMGVYPIQWDVDSLDWKNLSASEIAMRIVNGAKNGSIILCHNNGLHTAEALPIIFSTLQNRGFTFVPISELIYKQNYTIDANGRQHAAS